MTISTLPKTMSDLTKTAWTVVTSSSRLGLNVTQNGSPPYREEGKSLIITELQNSFMYVLHTADQVR